MVIQLPILPSFEPFLKIKVDGPPTVGLKADCDKLDYSLVDDDAEAEFVAVMTYGAVRYDRGNYLHVQDAAERYFAAARRHFARARKGEDRDPETGLLHLAHAQCCVHMAMAVYLRAHPELVATLEERFVRAMTSARALRKTRLAGQNQFASDVRSKPKKTPKRSMKPARADSKRVKKRS